MSVAQWCDRGNHPFRMDDGMNSFSITKRVPDDSGNIRVVQVQGDSCLTCEEQGPMFRPNTTPSITKAKPVDSEVIATSVNTQRPVAIIIDDDGDEWRQTDDGMWQLYRPDVGKFTGTPYVLQNVAGQFGISEIRYI